MELTQENLKRIDPSLSREERELELMDRMQTLSALLGRVDDALAAAPATPAEMSRPPTGKSATSRPPTGSVASARVMGPPPNEMAQMLVAARGGDNGGGVRMVDNGLPVDEDGNLKKSTVSLVNYSGNHSHTAQIQRLRKIDARAARSEMGSLLSWSGGAEAAKQGQQQK